MKVRIPLWKTILLLIAVSLLAAGAMFGMSFNLFLKPIKDWSAGAWVIIAVWFVLTVLLFVLALTTSYYEVNKKYVVVRRGTKRIIYYYSDVVYIDEQESIKHKTVSFYTNKGHVRYLPFDSKGVLYKVMLSQCKNRLTKEEFERRYPKVKI